MKKYKLILLILMCFTISVELFASPPDLYEDSLTLYEHNQNYIEYYNTFVYPLIKLHKATEARSIWLNKLAEPLAEELIIALNNLKKHNGETPKPYKTDEHFYSDSLNPNILRVTYFKKPTKLVTINMRRLGSRRNYKAKNIDTLEYNTRHE